MVAKEKKDGMATGTHNPLESEKSPPPPPYQFNPPDITAAFSNLKLEETDKPTPDHCIAHLKLLEAFHQLRCDVATNDGLFGIQDDFVPKGLSEQQHAETLLKIREKRWAIYVAKAAKRFEKWWQVSIEPDVEMVQQRALEKGRFDKNRNPLYFNKQTLPPLGKT